MAKFIKLRIISETENIYINSDLIDSFMFNHDNNSTSVRMKGDDTTFEVKEKPYQILALIEGES